eukprot:GHVQ01005029.1.p1 GENE.GHVQ01005029.1~~GHVQ01005029.1.p1  ORF type:complete len:479 (+),score=68.15 GHVQ01005029.1:80-1516(+)
MKEIIFLFSSRTSSSAACTLSKQEQPSLLLSASRKASQTQQYRHLLSLLCLIVCFTNTVLPTVTVWTTPTSSREISQPSYGILLVDAHSEVGLCSIGLRFLYDYAVSSLRRFPQLRLPNDSPTGSSDSREEIPMAPNAVNMLFCPTSAMAHYLPPADSFCRKERFKTVLSRDLLGDVVRTGILRVGTFYHYDIYGKEGGGIKWWQDYMEEVRSEMQDKLKYKMGITIGGVSGELQVHYVVYSGRNRKTDLLLALDRGDIHMTDLFFLHSSTLHNWIDPRFSYHPLAWHYDLPCPAAAIQTQLLVTKAVAKNFFPDYDKENDLSKFYEDTTQVNADIYGRFQDRGAGTTGFHNFLRTAHALRGPRAVLFLSEANRETIDIEAIVRDTSRDRRGGGVVSVVVNDVVTLLNSVSSERLNGNGYTLSVVAAIVSNVFDQDVLAEHGLVSVGLDLVTVHGPIFKKMIATDCLELEKLLYTGEQ